MLHFFLYYTFFFFSFNNKITLVSNCDCFLSSGKRFSKADTKTHITKIYVNYICKMEFIFSLLLLFFNKTHFVTPCIVLIYIRKLKMLLSTFKISF